MDGFFLHHCHWPLTNDCHELSSTSSSLSTHKGLKQRSILPLTILHAFCSEKQYMIHNRKSKQRTFICLLLLSLSLLRLVIISDLIYFMVKRKRMFIHRSTDCRRAMTRFDIVFWKLHPYFILNIFSFFVVLSKFKRPYYRILCKTWNDIKV